MQFSGILYNTKLKLQSISMQGRELQNEFEFGVGFGNTSYNKAKCMPHKINPHPAAHFNPMTSILKPNIILPP